MIYSIFISKEEDGIYSVTIPDLPGCHSIGDSFEDAMINAKEAIECHLEGMIKDGDIIPENPNPSLDYWNHPEIYGGSHACVSIDITKLDKSKRINITIPHYLLKQLDKYVKANNISSRSEFLVAAAMLAVRKQSIHERNIST